MWRPMRLDVGGSLAALRLAAKAQIDGAAERARLAFVTPGAAQALVYDAKRREAEAMTSDPAPAPALYPLLAAEVGITAPTLAGVGAAVRALAAEWTAAAAAIEGVRLAAKRAVDLALTPAEVRAAASGLSWPAPS